MAFVAAVAAPAVPIERLIAPLDMEATIPMDARAYKFDIVLRGRVNLVRAGEGHRDLILMSAVPDVVINGESIIQSALGIFLPMWDMGKVAIKR